VCEETIENISLTFLWDADQGLDFSQPARETAVQQPGRFGFETR